MDKLIVFFSFFILFFGNSYAKADYYLTLRNEKVNLRQGPSLEHPIKLIYKKKFLPVLIIDKSYNFRKITDHENNSGWIHISQLSKKKAALNNKERAVIYKKPSKYSKPIALVEKGRLLIIKKCKKNWCKINSEEFVGWVEIKNLKGRL